MTTSEALLRTGTNALHLMGMGVFGLFAGIVLLTTARTQHGRESRTA